jgi:hypothetical protein
MPSTPSDITLAVGDGARRMTYAELADVRGISAMSAERLARRRRWARQVGNDGVVRVLVPLAEARKSPRRTTLVRTRTSSRISPLTSAPDIPPDVRTMESALELLREQFERERGRADRAERHLEDERRRVDELQAALAEERRRLIAILTDQRRRPWWRRWFR